MQNRDSLVGHTLANYRIERLLGRGGMANVYYGIDLHLQRPVAVKVIGERFQEDAVHAARFWREARAMASWRHPNIPQIYQSGMEGVLVFYAMEYVQGQDLHQLLKEARQRGELLSFAEVLRIGRALAEALDYAHQKGAIHRDVKPSNVLMAEDGRILLTDFGLVLQLDQGTQGEVFGSPQYIAPEQARSSADAVPQSDLYALGVILYEMLVGSLPFEDPSPATLALQHMTVEPPHPRQLNPDLSPEIEALLLKALSKLPQQRHQTGLELAAALEEAVPVSTQRRRLPASAALPPDTLPVLPASPVLPDQSTQRNPRPAFPGSADTQVSPPRPAGEARAGAGPQDRAAAPPPRRKRAFAALAPALIIAACGLLAAVLGLRGLAADQDLPLQPALTSSSPLAERTSTEPVGLPTRQTEVPSTTTELTSPPTTTPTSTVTTAPSATPTLAPTPTPALTPTAAGGAPLPADREAYRIILIKYKDDSVYLINRGSAALPLADLRLGRGNSQLLGSEWQIDTLQPQECVSVWKKEGNPRPPQDLDCKEVGPRLVRSGANKFWVKDYAVYFSGEEIGRCGRKSERCELEFSRQRP